MSMNRLRIVFLCLAAPCCLMAASNTQNCSGLPTHFTGGEFPTGNFFSNFDNNCYLIPFSSGNGSGGEQGDLNSLYNKIFFNACPAGANPLNCINPNLPPYELIILGEFTNARYFSISLYDNHSALAQNISDVNIVPLTSKDINTYEPGVAFVNGQHYGAAIHLGGTPGKIEKGCMMTGYNVESNVMDGTLRHPFMNWNLDKPFLQPGNELLHEVDNPEHTNPNLAGVVIIRSYLDLTALTSATQPHLIVRDVASGCAYPAAYVLGTMNVVTNDSNTGNTWQNQQQVQEHSVYANWQSTDCWGSLPPQNNVLQWLRQDEYVAGSNPDAAYLITNVPSGLPQTLFNGGQVFLIQFKVPATPPTPCTNGCSRSGSEEMRYMSISFQLPGGGTLASLPDTCPANPTIPCTPLVQDSKGNVNLVVSFGTPQPSWVSAANGYTWLDLSQVGNPTYMQLNEIAIRHILPSTWFNCGAQVVPYKVGEATTQAEGLMGLFSPAVTEPVATKLPSVAQPFKGVGPDPTACSIFPVGPPAVSPGCQVLTPNPTTISAVTTQCANPGCSGIVLQATPPISILGTGFGSFPYGLPYTGISNYLDIIDTTQGWTAGYVGSPCTVSIGEWSDGLVSMIANVNQNGACPMAAGDSVTVRVYNPQTLNSASAQIIVAAQGNTSTSTQR